MGLYPASNPRGGVVWWSGLFFLCMWLYASPLHFLQSIVDGLGWVLFYGLLEVNVLLAILLGGCVGGGLFDCVWLRRGVEI